MKLNGLKELFLDELQDLYSAELQLVKALPKMAKTASSEQLRTAFTDHLVQTRGHVNRLERIGEELELTLLGKKCKAMAGLIKEGKEVIDSEGDHDVIDLALVAAAQRVEHYEISAYGSARALAEQLGKSSAVQLLQETLDEESAADEKLTNIAVHDLYPKANHNGAAHEDILDEETLDEDAPIGQDITPTDESDEEMSGLPREKRGASPRARNDR